MGWWHSRRLHFLVAGVLAWFLLLAALRGVFYVFFSEVGDTVDAPTADVLQALGVGLRFDVRLAILLMLPVMVLAWIPRFNLTTSPLPRLLARVYLGLAVVLVLLTYIFDFGHYGYLGERLNVTAFRFLENTDISTQMIWESYPVVWILLGWLATVVVMILVFSKIVSATLERAPVPIRLRSRWIGGFLVFWIVAFGLLGRYGPVNLENPVPLRWNDAFASGNQAVGALGLNPIIFLYDTSLVNAEPYDQEAVEKYYPMMAGFLGIPEDQRQNLNFRRQVSVQPHRLDAERPPNVVVIMLESLGASRVGAYGMPFDPTPNLDKIAEDGWFFEHFYVPVTGTAKSIWAFFTGTPDASPEETASRNPLIADQNLVLNAMEEYHKLYFVGGSAGWANLSGMLKRSIDDLEMYEEGDWQSPNVDVWGISDLDLFKESNDILEAIPEDEPFFAFIQTAGNHRPFTIPANNDGFEARDMDEDELAEYGFKSAAQYNAVRLLDYNVGRYMDMARQSDYFDNTIFVFFGDHNNRITTLPHMPKFQEALRLESHHVPHMIYSPRHLEPRTFDQAVSLVDVMPTLAGLLGVEYQNGTLGRDIQIPVPEDQRAAFVIPIEGARPEIGTVTRDDYVSMSHDGASATLHDLHSDDPVKDRAEEDPERFQALSALTRGLYETSRYLLYDNAVIDEDQAAQEPRE